MQHRSAQIDSSLHIVAVIVETAIETPLDNVDKVIKPGLYVFSNKVAARAFTTAVNFDSDTIRAKYFAPQPATTVAQPKGLPNV